MRKRMVDGETINEMGVDLKKSYVLALDIGTTTLKAKIYTESGQIHSTSSTLVIIIFLFSSFTVLNATF